MSKTRCAKCGVKGRSSPATATKPAGLKILRDRKIAAAKADADLELVVLHSIRVEGEVVKLCDECRARLEDADRQPADPAKVVSKPGPQAASMRLSPSGVPLVMPREKPIEIARPLSWRRS